MYYRKTKLKVNENISLYNNDLYCIELMNDNNELIQRFKRFDDVLECDEFFENMKKARLRKTENKAVNND